MLMQITCPACRKKGLFDGSSSETASCTRCGAELTALLRLEQRVQYLRAAILKLIASGDLHRAHLETIKLTKLENSTQHQQLLRALATVVG